MMRPEVEEALREALAEWNGKDLPNALLEQADSDYGFNLGWSKPEEARRILRALIELGVRLGVGEAKRLALLKVKGSKPSSEGTAMILEGAEFHHFWRELDAITVASVLEGGK